MILRVENLTSSELIETLSQLIDEKFDTFKRQPKKEYLTVKETADYCGVTKTTIHEWLRQGKIPKYKINSRTLIRSEDVKSRIAKIESK